MPPFLASGKVEESLSFCQPELCMEISKIMIPIDGSEHSKHALLYALGLAQGQKATIVLLHCYGRIPMLIGGEGRIQLTKELHEESEKLMEPFAAS